MSAERAFKHIKFGPQEHNLGLEALVDGFSGHNGLMRQRVACVSVFDDEGLCTVR